MAECDLEIEEVRFGTGSTAWRVKASSSSSPFNEDSACTVKVTANGIPVTGTGHYKGLHITGWSSWNGGVVLDEPLPKRGEIEWEVICPDCTWKQKIEFKEEFDPAGRRWRIFFDALPKIKHQ